MPSQPLRRPAVAGSWYPGSPQALTAAVDRYVAGVKEVPRGTVTGLVSPHAGLMYSGPVAAHAYAAAASGSYDVAVLVGPSHHVGFDGVAVFARGAFDTPLGPMEVAEADAAAILRHTPVARENPAAHAREHSLEMQLPFLARLLPATPIVPLVMGYQTRETIRALADGLGQALAGRRVLLIASSDLSHYQDARTAKQLDGEVLQAVAEFDADALLSLLERYPEHACGGGPMVAVMRAARLLGAADARVLKYADSGDVSGDKSAVVGYMAAVFGRFERDGTRG
ncbi:MAG: AmmeMemoRadiSam system protein B [Acidobacteria bacterium]|nr:AmmeMemoRadiSam system protein B [Acidobacteriota bacterium]